MIRKFTISFLFLLIMGVGTGLFANPINSEKAEKIAKNFYFERGQQVIPNLEFSTINLQLYLTKKSSYGNAYYVFNLDDNKGFIITSADDDAYPIIAYSFKESYDSENLSPALVEMMNNYELQISEIQSKGLKADKVIRDEWISLETTNYNPKSVNSVSPLLSTTWRQGTYYNTDCPVDAAGEDGHVYVGCVATAMAQIMKYYSYPAQGTGSHSYYYYPYGTISADFGNSTYDWASMPNHAYGYNSALALINFHCGVSVDMMYGSNGSGAYTSDVVDALVDYFDYSSTANFVYKSNYTTTGWQNILVNELDNGRPVEYQGTGSEGGHAFVCDGYQTSSYFHFNWGWGGYADGYYYLNNLNPGGTTFNENQGAVIGIEPNGGGGGTLDPPTDFAVTNGGYATWTAPGGGGGGGNSAWLSYDDGTNVDGIGGPDVFSWGIKFDPAQLTDYAGTSITKINIYNRTYATNTLQIFEGTNAATLIYEQDLSGLTLNAWNEVELTTPVPIDATQQLWITVYTEDGANYPAAVGANMGEPNGDLITLDGATWEHLSDYGLMYTWNLGCYVTDGTGKTVSLGKIPNTKTYNSSTKLLASTGRVNNSPNATRPRGLLGYQLYLDGAAVGSTSDLFWQYTNLTPGQTYTAGVSALYDEGESDMVEYEFTATGGANGPVIEVLPNMLTEVHNNPPEITMQYLLISNTGDEPLIWNISVGSKATGYCDASTTTEDEYIANVLCGDINNSSSWQGGVADYTDQSTVINAGESEDITITNGNAWASDNVTVWVDWNDDFEFTQGGNEEFVLTNVGGIGESFTGVITAPADANNGDHRMRVRMTYSSAPVPCGNSGYGEVEDYTVTTGGGQSSNWLTVDMTNGTIEPGMATDVVVTFNSEGMDPGLYNGLISISSNDPNNSLVEVPVEFTVGGTQLDPPTDFMVTDDGYATWSAPGGGGGGTSAWLSYDDDINVDGIGGPDIFSWGIKFDPAQLADYAGTSITKIDIYNRTGATNTLQIFEGTNAANLIYEQDLSGLDLDSWNEVELNTPVPIDATQQLWITVYTEDGANYPAAVGADMGEPNGDLITLDGVTWEHLSDYGLMYTWNLGCYVTDGTGKTVSLGEIPNTKTYKGSTEPFAPTGKVNNSPNATRSRGLLGYQLYLDGAAVGSTSDLFYQYTDLTPGQTYMAGVSALYDEGESDMVEYEFTATGGCNPPSDWTVNPADFAYNGEVTAQVFIDDVAVENGTLAAFVGDECRGVVDATYFPVGQYYVFTIMCYSNMASGETLNFKYFNPASCGVCELDGNVDFVADMIEGTPDNPLVFNCGGTVTATIDLASGWTWFSLNVDDDDMSLDNVLGSLSLSENDYIKNQTNSATYYAGYGWYGALTEIDPTQMYQINLANSDVLEFTGMAVDPSTTPINLNSGWTWIGYIPQSDLDINVALESLTLDENDYIKNQTGSATYYSGYGWYGALDILSPYDGYKINLLNADVLTYPSTSMKSSPESKQPVFANNTGITVNPYRYEYNGTVTARVFNNNKLSNSKDDLLLAYVGNECRGISKAMYFEPTGEFEYPLMIYSNVAEGETVSFKYFDSKNNEMYDCNETIKFTNDMIIADAFHTIDLNTKSTLGINNLTDNVTFNVYPNPSNGITTIDYTLKAASHIRIVVSDIYGKQIEVIENDVKSAGNHTSRWNAGVYEDGTYFIKIVSGDSIQIKKVLLIN